MNKFPPQNEKTDSISDSVRVEYRYIRVDSIVHVPLPPDPEREFPGQV